MALRLVLLAAVLLSSGCAPSAQVPTPVALTPAQAERAARLDSALAVLHTSGLFEGALAISDGDGRIVYRAAMGSYQGRPVTTETPMVLASVTKAMTSAAALSLAADGLLDLDAPAGRYLDPWPYPEVTVRMLMDQTAGLHFLTALTAHRDLSQAKVTTADLLAIVAEHRPGTVHEPGTAFDYDNANYEALAAVIEAASGQPYAEVMRERVLEPAGMDHASPDGSGGIAWAGWSGGGGDAVQASVEDLLAFDDAFWAGRVVPQRFVEAALRPPTLADGSASRYVFGRFVETDPRPLVGHFGEGGETKSALYRERAEGGLPGTTYALIATADGVYRTPVLTAVMAIWNGEPFALPLPRPTAIVPEAVLARHVGVYESGFGRLHVTLENGQLHLEPEGAGGSEPLVAGSETVFYFCCQDLTWEFVLDEAGATVGIQLRGQAETFGEKVE